MKSVLENISTVKAWVIKAIAEEDLRPRTQLWSGEPTYQRQKEESRRRARSFRRHRDETTADRLETCRPKSRCCSGACPECLWLLQRWLVRRSKGFINSIVDKNDRVLVAITIVPSRPIVRPGHLNKFKIINFQRRLRSVLDAIGLVEAIGGIDFSFNEDRDQMYKPFWCPHIYVICSVASEDRARHALKNVFRHDYRIPRPVKISTFNNSARRRSYAFKTEFIRRIGYEEIKSNGRKCRNTSRDKLRTAERLELFRYLNRCGLAQFLIFKGCKPVTDDMRVRIRRIAPTTSHQSKSKKAQKMTKNRSKNASFAHS